MLGNGLREGKKTDKRIIITVNVPPAEQAVIDGVTT
jgi:hypothetical protein